MTRLVIDASFCVHACGIADGFQLLEDAELVAPALMWAESRSAIREARWRKEIDEVDAATTYTRLAICPVEQIDRGDLHMEIWRVAQELGWAKTYDAEYVALARLLNCQLITLDGRLRRSADRLGVVITPDEL